MTSRACGRFTIARSETDQTLPAVARGMAAGQAWGQRVYQAAIRSTRTN
jgi:hypothetical protein